MKTLNYEIKTLALKIDALNEVYASHEVKMLLADEEEKYLINSALNAVTEELRKLVKTYKELVNLGFFGKVCFYISRVF